MSVPEASGMVSRDFIDTYSRHFPFSSCFHISLDVCGTRLANLVFPVQALREAIPVAGATCFDDTEKLGEVRATGHAYKQAITIAARTGMHGL